LGWRIDDQKSPETRPSDGRDRIKRSRYGLDD
jgi:hypothetical protein